MPLSLPLLNILFRDAEKGYVEFSYAIIEEILEELKENNLGEPGRKYLIGCLEKTIELKSADMAFRLKYKGKKIRKDNRQRDSFLALAVQNKMREGMSLDKACEAVEEDHGVSTSALRKIYSDAKYWWDAWDKAVGVKK